MEKTVENKTVAPVKSAIELMKEARDMAIAELKKRKAELVEFLAIQENILRQICHKLFGTIYFDEKYLVKKRTEKIILFFVLAVIACVEWPINRTGMLPMGLSDTGTDIMAAFFGVACAVGAYYSGHFLKRGQAEKNSNKVWIGISITVAALVIFLTLANLRVQYLQEEDSGITVGVFMWTAMSFAVYFFGFAASYKTEGDIKNSEIERAYCTELKKYSNAKKDIKRIDLEISSITKEYSKKLIKQSTKDAEDAREEAHKKAEEDELKKINNLRNHKKVEETEKV